MDSRQFAILVLAIFISALALALGETNVVSVEPPMNNSSEITTTTIKPAAVHAAAVSSSTAELVSSTESSSSAANPKETIASSATTAAVKEDLTKEVFSTTLKITETSTASTSATPAASTTNSPKSTEVVNDHSIREASSVKCSTAYDTANKTNWVPEEAILAVLKGNAVVTVDQLCKHLKEIELLDTICNNTKVKLDADDFKVAPIVAGLNSMFSNFCNDTKSFSVPAGNSTPCVELIQSTTKKCSTNPKAVFPTEVLFEDIVKENCTVVFKTKECIINGLEQSDKCTEPQRAALKETINMVAKVLPCSLPISTEKTSDASTEAQSITTTTTTTPSTTTTPTVTTTKSHSHSSANGFQVNFFTVLPVLLLAFKFY